jgi:IS5 family transposase
VIKHCEQNALKKSHNARIDDDVYNQRSMSETVFAMLKDDGDEIRSRSWHGQFRELTRRCIMHNLEQAASWGSPPAPFLRMYLGEASPSSISYFVQYLVKLML